MQENRDVNCVILRSRQYYYYKSSQHTVYSMVVNHKEANGESDAKRHKTFQCVTSVMTHSVPGSVERTNTDIRGLRTIYTDTHDDSMYLFFFVPVLSRHLGSPV